MVDATTLLRIATGRDAADTAFLMTIRGAVTLTGLTVSATVDELPQKTASALDDTTCSRAHLQTDKGVTLSPPPHWGSVQEQQHGDQGALHHQIDRGDGGELQLPSPGLNPVHQAANGHR